MSTLRIAFVRDTPMPYRVSNAFSGELLGMFPTSKQMHLFLSGVRAGYEGPALNPHSHALEVEV